MQAAPKDLCQAVWTWDANSSLVFSSMKWQWKKSVLPTSQECKEGKDVEGRKEGFPSSSLSTSHHGCCKSKRFLGITTWCRVYAQGIFGSEPEAVWAWREVTSLESSGMKQSQVPRAIGHLRDALTTATVRVLTLSWLLCKKYLLIHLTLWG